MPLSQTPQLSPLTLFPPFVPPRELDEEISADLADEVGVAALLQLAPRLWGRELWAGGGPVGLGCCVCSLSSLSGCRRRSPRMTLRMASRTCSSSWQGRWVRPCHAKLWEDPGRALGWRGDGTLGHQAAESRGFLKKGSWGLW